MRINGTEIAVQQIRVKFRYDTNLIIASRSHDFDFPNHLEITTIMVDPNNFEKQNFKCNMKNALIYAHQMGYDGFIIKRKDSFSFPVQKHLDKGIEEGWLEKTGKSEITKVFKIEKIK
jgi:hypothetical protein